MLLLTGTLKIAISRRVVAVLRVIVVMIVIMIIVLIVLIVLTVTVVESAEPIRSLLNIIPTKLLLLLQNVLRLTVLMLFLLLALSRYGLHRPLKLFNSSRQVVQNQPRVQTLKVIC